MTPQDVKNIETIKNSVKLIRNFVGYDSAISSIAKLTKLTENPNFWDNPEEAVKTTKEKDRLMNAINPVDYLESKLNDMVGLLELAEHENDENLISEISRNLNNLAAEATTLQIEAILSDKHDSLNCFLEINAGAGGTEAQDWAEMLARMYSRWAEKKKYSIEITDKNDGEEAGVKSITLHIKGDKAYGWLKKESGVHRLVRISPFDSNARRHTSFASVLVMPELNTDIEIEINPNDLRVDTYRSSGAGGQHVNKTDSAVRITHIPTGIVTASQVDRSQHRNREIAMNMLKSKLYAKKLREQEEEANKLQTKTDIAWGNQIRSYVLQPYQMVKDVRTGVEQGNAAAVLDGEINVFLESAVSLAADKYFKSS
ncbi:MAG: peptide chain release factor 2 [Holosporales bacterium]|jgi:peptide chain release factor 2|nr:peptide chain release factor 2 [Holosporales bacterium]